MNMSKEQQSEIRYEVKKSWKRRLLDYVVITLAALLYSVAVSCFLDPNSLAPGGVTGVSIILNRIIPVKTGTLVFLINIPILLLGTWKFGIRFICSTIYCTAITSLFINGLKKVGPLTSDPFLAAVAGGAIMALGLGLIFKCGATTGGTDIIVKILRMRFPHIKTGAMFMIMDTMIVVLSAIVFKNIDVALYAGLVVLIDSSVIDVVLYGRDGAKMLFIISNKPREIAKRLLEELDVGVTYLSGQGAYSGKDKDVLLCVVKKQLSPKVEQVVREEDSGVFMIVSNANEIFGEGYKSIFSERL